MNILVVVILALFSLLCKLGDSFDLNIQRSVRRKHSRKWTEWAREHEDEWINGTDLFVRENGRLMYYPRKISSISGYPVHYGCNSRGDEYGLIYRGSVVFTYEQIIRAKATNNRVQKSQINMGVKKGTVGDVYKNVGENRYFYMGREIYPQFINGRFQYFTERRY